MSKLPTTVTLDNCHNHPLDAADIDRHRVCAAVKAKFKHLFCRGHSVQTARDSHHMQKPEELGEDYHKTLADGSFFHLTTGYTARNGFRVRLHRTIFHEKLEDKGGYGLVKLKDYVDSHSDSMKMGFG